MLSVYLLISSALAWFSNYDTADDLSFKILQIDSEVRVYAATDGNFNGVPDLLTAEHDNQYYNDYAETDSEGHIINTSYQTYTDYTNQYYDEKFDFTLKDSKIALSSDSTANLFNVISLTEVAPSKIYTFKFEMFNYVGAVNTLAFGFSNTYTGNLTTLSNFECRVGVLSTTNGENVSYDFTDWSSFTDGSSYSGLSLISGVEIGATNEYTHLSGRKDIWLQIRMKSDAKNMALNEFALPDFRITFMFDYEKV